MAFLIYFFVLLVSAASVLFGLDLMSAPLPKTPNVPIGRNVQVTAQAPVQEPYKKAADERALTPVYPTTPGAPKVQAETSGAAPQQDAKLTPPPAEQAAPAVTPAPPPAATAPATTATVAENPPVAAVAPAPTVAQNAPASAAPAPNVAQNAPAPAATVATAPEPQQQAKAAEPAASTAPATTEAKLEPAAAAPPPAAAVNAEPAATTQPVQQAASKSCNVQACGAAYQSFRASDCSYQPYGGERRLCSMTSGAVTARAAKPDRPEQSSRRSGAPDDLRDVERVVRRQPLELRPAAPRSSATASRGEMTEVERIVRHMTRDDDADIPVEDGDGRLFIVRKTYR